MKPNRPDPPHPHSLVPRGSGIASHVPAGGPPLAPLSPPHPARLGRLGPLLALLPRASRTCPLLGCSPPRRPAMRFSQRFRASGASSALHATHSCQALTLLTRSCPHPMQRWSTPYMRPIASPIRSTQLQRSACVLKARSDTHLTYQ
jgi:hypothetical protein